MGTPEKGRRMRLTGHLCRMDYGANDLDGGVIDS
jgi:hypothetical protein